jgi:hypothetical protein
MIRAIPVVATRTIRRKDPTSFCHSSSTDPDRKRITAVVVIPNRNISTRAAEAIYNTQWPKTSGGKLRSRRAKPANPKREILIFPASDRKFASVVTFLIVAFKLFFIKCMT